VVFRALGRYFRPRYLSLGHPRRFWHHSWGCFVLRGVVLGAQVEGGVRNTPRLAMPEVAGDTWDGPHPERLPTVVVGV